MREASHFLTGQYDAESGFAGEDAVYLRHNKGGVYELFSFDGRSRTKLPVGRLAFGDI